jgi:hypothetical protein
MSVNVGNLINKTKIVPFLNKGTNDNPDWLQIKKSTSFNLSMNPTTKTFAFISEINESEEVTGYKPALSQEVILFKGEPDYELVFDLFYHRPTGAQAHKQVLVAFYQEERKYTPSGGEEKTIFMGWLIDALVKVNNLDTENEHIAVDFSFNHIDECAIEIEGGKPKVIKGTFSGAKNETFTPDA